MPRIMNIKSVQPPPTKGPIALHGFVTSAWAGFFNSVYDRLKIANDGVITFEPENAGITGTITATGYYAKNGNVLQFSVFVTPTGSVSSTLGASFFILPVLKNESKTFYNYLCEGSCAIFNTVSKALIGNALIEPTIVSVSPGVVASQGVINLPSFTTSDPFVITGSVITDK